MILKHILITLLNIKNIRKCWGFFYFLTFCINFYCNYPTLIVLRNQSRRKSRCSAAKFNNYACAHQPHPFILQQQWSLVRFLAVFIRAIKTFYFDRILAPDSHISGANCLIRKHLYLNFHLSLQNNRQTTKETYRTHYQRYFSQSMA